MPVVGARCMEQNLSGSDAKLLYLDADGLSVKELIVVDSLVQRNISGGTIDDEKYRYFSPIWFTLQEPGSTLQAGLFVGWKSRVSDHTVSKNLNVSTQTERISEVTPHDVRGIELDITNSDVLRDANLLALISKSARSGGPLSDFEVPIVLSSAFSLAVSELPKVNNYWGWATTDFQENSTELTITKYGFGYSTISRSICQAMAVMAAYFPATIAHLS
ncbi:hypothetical protein SLS61_004550 [Didymella pomorum]